MPILDHQSQIRELPYSSGYKEGGSRTDYKEDHARRITLRHIDGVLDP